MAGDTVILRNGRVDRAAHFRRRTKVAALARILRTRENLGPGRDERRGGWVYPLGVGDEDVTVFVTRGHCMTYPMPRMGGRRIDGASGLVILVLFVPFDLCHLGESLAGVVAKRGKFGRGFDLLGVARSGCAVVLYALDLHFCAATVPVTKRGCAYAVERPGYPV